MKKTLTIASVVAIGFLIYVVYGFRPEFEGHVNLKYAVVATAWVLLLAALTAAIVKLFANLIRSQKKTEPTDREMLKSLSITRKPMGSRNPLTLPTTICAVSVGLIAAVMALMYFFDIQTPQ